jgi:HD-like signal output (HDOD) protein
MSTDSDTLDRNADQIVGEIGIPPCPAILTKLLRETRAEEPDFRRVGQFIGGDVALASAVLKIANSPFYGARTKAASVQQALVLLGLGTVTQLVTGLLLRQAFSGAAGPGMERYWKA